MVTSCGNSVGRRILLYGLRSGTLSPKPLYALFHLQLFGSSYQEILDDSVTPTIQASLGSVMTRLRPDRVLALASLSTPKDKYQDQ